MRPIARAHITKILAQLGLRIGGAPRPGEATIAWDVGTWFSDRAAARLPPGTINGECLDVSKSRVDREWAAAAGYSVAVDPTTWDGPLVRKSELNGVHDGRLLHGPLEARRDGYVYQRYVDAVEGTSSLELRTVVIDGEIPIVIRRWRQAANWHGTSTHAETIRAEDAYSPEEVGHLLAFAAAMRLEYGELDVLRDKTSGLIYVIDANRTPSGPPRKLAAAAGQDAAERMAAPFARLMAERWG